MKKKIQKPFDVEAAKNGAKVETRDGKSVRIVCYDVAGTRFPILALVNYTINCKNSEDCFAYNIEGKLESGEIYNGRNDLVIVEEVEETKFNVGDWVFATKYGKHSWLITARNFDYYEVQDTQGLKTSVAQTTIDSCYHLWTLKDARPGDILIREDGKYPFIFKECFGGNPFAYCCIDPTDSIFIGTDISWLSTTVNVRPATYKERQEFFNRLEKEGYKWEAESLTLSKIQERWRDKEDAVVNGYFIYSDSQITSHSGYNTCVNYNVFATKKQIKSALAMARISQIMANDKRFGGVIADEEWIHHENWVILRHNNTLMVTTRRAYEYLSFHTREQAELFLKENEDLIKDYYMLD